MISAEAYLETRAHRPGSSKCVTSRRTATFNIPVPDVSHVDEHAVQEQLIDIVLRTPDCVAEGYRREHVAVVAFRIAYSPKGA